MTQRLIMIGGWAEIYKKAKEVGFYLTVVQRKEDLKLDELQFIDQIIMSPVSDKIVVDLVSTIHEKYPFDAVVSFQEFGVLNAALINERLNLRGNPLRPVALTRDKNAMRQHMQEFGLPSIPFLRVKNIQDVVDFARQHGFPLILKPANGIGSLQVHKLHSEVEIERAFNSIKSDAYAREIIINDFPELGVIVERFVTGPEVSVEAVTCDGIHTILGVTDKITTGHPNFVEMGHTMPSILPSDRVDEITRLTTQFLDSIGHQCGPSHTELILSDEGSIIIESHTRAGGGCIYEMGTLSYGIDMFEITLKSLFDGKPEIARKPTTGAAVRFISIPEGKITEISGLTEASESPGIMRVDLKRRVGDIAVTAQHSIQRHGYVMGTGVDRTSAVENVSRAMSILDIRVEPAK